MAGVPDGGPACGPDWNELLPDEAVYRVCGRPSFRRPRAGQGRTLSPVVQLIQALHLSFHSFCPSIRCTTQKIHSTSWSPFPWRGKPTSLKNESQNIKDLGSCQAPWTLSLPWMRTSDTKTASCCILYIYNLFFSVI